MITPPKPTILIVDDDRLNRAALAELLQDECRVLLAKDGPAGLQVLAEEDVSLVLLDVSMPGMDGYEVLRRIKSSPKTADVSVVFITGMSEVEDETRGLLLGAADYVQKPIRPAIVRARVQVHLKLAAQRRELERLSLFDALTNIANRRYFDEAFARAHRSAVRQGHCLGVALIDVDHFKLYNDHYGHAAGDNVLRAVAHTLQQSMRRSGDMVARYGGEEFAILMPEVTDFQRILSSVCEMVLAQGIVHERSLTACHLTISCGGFAAEPGKDPALSAQAMLKRADDLLYEAKRDGRNRAIVATTFSQMAGAV